MYLSDGIAPWWVFDWSPRVELVWWYLYIYMRAHIIQAVLTLSHRYPLHRPRSPSSPAVQFYDFLMPRFSLFPGSIDIQGATRMRRRHWCGTSIARSNNVTYSTLPLHVTFRYKIKTMPKWKSGFAAYSLQYSEPSQRHIDVNTSWKYLDGKTLTNFPVLISTGSTRMVEYVPLLFTSYSWSWPIWLLYKFSTQCMLS